MHCESCVELITEVCKEAAGVSKCSVDLKNGTASIEHDDTLDLKALLTELHTLGDYEITPDTST